MVVSLEAASTMRILARDAGCTLNVAEAVMALGPSVTVSVGRVAGTTTVVATVAVTVAVTVPAENVALAGVPDVAGTVTVPDVVVMLAGPAYEVATLS